jgi:hypothetical protein
MARLIVALIASCAAVAFAIVALSGAQAHAAGTTLAFAPASQTVSAGANGSVDVTVASVGNLASYHVQITFNPSAIHVTSMTDSGFLASAGRVAGCTPVQIDNTAGTATLDCFTLNPLGTGLPASTVSAQPLVHVAFTGAGAGTSTLALTGSQLYDLGDVAIPASLTAGGVTVTAAASVGGTAEIPDVAALPERHGSGAPFLWAVVVAAGVAGAAALSLALVRLR